MTNVFLSYDREDVARAKSVASLIEGAGHSVWWDRHIRGGAQYTKEIERALEESDAVVVLWSSASVNSEWVRDEAAEGRDRGKLVPVLLSAVRPPMGFRQFQTIDLSDWRGDDGHGAAQALLEALAAEGTAPVRSARPAPPSPAQQSAKFDLRRYALPLVALALVVAAVGAWFFLRGGAEAQTVIVRAADSQPLSQSLARNLLVRLGILQTNYSDALKIIDGGSGGEAESDLQLSVNGSREGNGARASVSLVSSDDRAVIWSKTFGEESTSTADVEEQMAFSVGRVLQCAAEGAARENGGLDDSVRKAYLNACALTAELGWDKRPAVPLLRDVLEASPNFRPAWAKLLIMEAEVVSYLRADLQSVDVQREQLRDDIARARKLYPDMAEATLAEMELIDKIPVVKALEFADRAKEQDAENPVVLGARSMYLQAVGRTQEAISDSQRAAELDPLSPDLKTNYIRALAYGGQIERARVELAKAQKLWPQTRTVRDLAFSLEWRFGDFEKAMRENPDGQTMSPSYIRARRDPTDSNVAAFTASLDQAPSESALISFGLQGLGEMNRPDAFFDFAARHRAAEILGVDSYILFRPWLASIRRDPRFMALAADLGLVRYWKSSGKWPDFCRDPDLTYDCKAEAAKLG